MEFADPPKPIVGDPAASGPSPPWLSRAELSSNSLGSRAWPVPPSSAGCRGNAPTPERVAAEFGPARPRRRRPPGGWVPDDRLGGVCKLHTPSLPDFPSIVIYIALKVIVPQLWKGACVVMDNAKFHQGEMVRKSLEQAGARLIYLLPILLSFPRGKIFGRYSKQFKKRSKPELIKI